MAAQMKPSEFDRQSVMYVDKSGLQHSGVVVGQSSDEQWFYIQSDRPDVPDADWHFKVARAALPGVLEVRG